VKRAGLSAAFVLLGLGVACTVGPRYSRPSAPAPAPDAWKTQPPWQQAAPQDSIPKGEWWKIFNDAELNAYEQQLLQANQSLVAARDRLDQARSLARVATAGLFPQVSVDPTAVRERGSGNRPLNGAQPTNVNGTGQFVPPFTQSVYSLPFSLSYEVDLFGRVRRGVEAANASLQSSAADLQNVQLVLTAELAADYFSLRELDAEFDVVQESVGYERKGLDLVNNRHSGGVANGLELAQQATVLDSTVSQLSLVQQTRAQFEHAIAVLVGQSASNLNVRVAPLQATPPPVPLGVPSDVLERRPDISEGGNRIGEEHDAEAGKGEIENRLEIVGRRVAFYEYDIRVLRHGAGSRDREHRNGNINARGCAVAPSPESEQKRGGATAAAEIENAFPFPRCSKFQRGIGNLLDMEIDFFLKARPAFAGETVPVFDLLRVWRGDHAMPLFLRRASVRSRSAFSLMNPWASF